MEHKNVFYDVLTPVHFISRSAKIYPNKAAVVYNDKRYTYTDFYARVCRLASALKKIGIQKGDKVAFICPNIPPMLEAHFAVPIIGAVLVSINIRLAAQEVCYIINHSESKAVFVDKGYRGIDVPGVTIWRSGQKRGVTPAIKKAIHWEMR